MCVCVCVCLSFRVHRQRYGTRKAWPLTAVLGPVANLLTGDSAGPHQFLGASSQASQPSTLIRGGYITDTV